MNVYLLPRHSVYILFIIGITMVTNPLSIDAADHITENCNSFALDLFKKVGQADENVFLSPYSIVSALSMTYLGARTSTQAEMASVLRFNTDQHAVAGFFSSVDKSMQTAAIKKAVELYTANSMWAQKSFQISPSYTSLLKKYYSSEINRTDFKDTEKSRSLINAWVEEHTKHKIQELIPKGLLSELTRLVIANAIYFKGRWSTQFKKDETTEMQFHKNPNDSVTMPFMHREDRYNYYTDSTVQVIELPYEGKKVSMYLFLPKDPTGLELFLENFTIQTLDSLIGAVQSQKIQLYLPRFSSTYATLLGPVLRDMGMKEAFSDQADFSGITGQKNIKISEVVHKAFIDVNEEGTEAAASSAVVMRYLGIEEVPDFIADHPFLYLIVKNDPKLILFMGKFTGKN